MSLRFDADGELLKTTTNLPSITGFTMMAWGFISVDQAGHTSSYAAFGQTSGAFFYEIDAEHPASVNVLGLWNGSSLVTGSTLPNSVWYHVAMVCDGTGAGNFRAYLNGVLDITHAGNASVTAQELTFGERTSGTSGDGINGRLAAIKVYAGVLTAAEIANEMRYFMPVRTANLNTWLPCVDQASANWGKDVSGNGYNMTVAGTLAFEDGPPIAWRKTRIRYFIPLTVTATLDQKSFRWRNDDGTESSATWAATQEADFMAPAGSQKRLRMVLDGSGDPAAANYLLEGKKSTDGTWVKI